MSLNISKIIKVSAAIATVACATVVANPTQAQAQVNGPFSAWDYAVAGKNNGSGGSAYDYRGIAVKEDGDNIIVAINAGMGIGGTLYKNEVINHGDLFFNFTGKTFKQASDAGELVAVKFATAGTQSGVTQAGVYSNVKAKSVTTQNYGYSNMSGWSNWAKNANGGVHNDSYGDLNARDSYFAGMQTGSNTFLNSINSGNKVADVMMMSTSQLAAKGLNFASATGANGTKADAAVTFGFSFKRTADFKVGNFIANLWAECGNDGVGMKGRFHKVPEPATMLGIAAVAGLGIAARRRRTVK
jgi:hypothetical protein